MIVGVTMTNNSDPPTTDSGSSFPDDMAQYLQVYIDESEEELEGLVGSILELETDPRHSEALQKSFRMLHSLKGSSGMMGFETVANLAHELEDRFERYRSGHAALDRETTTLVLECIDYFRAFLKRLRASDFSEGDPTLLLNRLREVAQQRAADLPQPQQLRTGVPAVAMTVAGGFRLIVRFRPGLQLADLKARLIVSRLSSIGEIIACEPPIDDAHSFSTAESITEISGRGVGMDIVRNAISDLSGTIDVSSIPGQGTTFTVRLPLTLAIIHSLLMRYEDDFFSIPIEDVREIVSIPRSEVHVVHRHVTIEVRGELVPLVGMGAIFNWRSSTSPSIGSHSSGAVNIVVLHARGKTLGLSVDSLVGRADLVIKSLSENFYPVRGLSGASILGDGAVCLMLDSAALMEMATERAQLSSVR